jgi:hypothetical protein
MNRIVNLTKRVKTAEGLRYCPVVEAANGRVKPDVVIVNGQEERHPEGGWRCRSAMWKHLIVRCGFTKDWDFGL